MLEDGVRSIRDVVKTSTSRAGPVFNLRIAESMYSGHPREYHRVISWAVVAQLFNQVNFRHHANYTIVIFRPKRSTVFLLTESSPEVLTFPDKDRVISAVHELPDVSAIPLVK